MWMQRHNLSVKYIQMPFFIIGKNVSTWLFIDTDEFIYPLNGDGILNIVDFVIKKYEDKNPAGLYMNWLFFGSSGHETKPQGFVIRKLSIQIRLYL